MEEQHPNGQPENVFEGLPIIESTSTDSDFFFGEEFDSFLQNLSANDEFLPMDPENEIDQPLAGYETDAYCPCDQDDFEHMGLQITTETPRVVKRKKAPKRTGRKSPTASSTSSSPRAQSVNEEDTWITLSHEQLCARKEELEKQEANAKHKHRKNIKCEKCNLEALLKKIEILISGKSKSDTVTPSKRLQSKSCSSSSTKKRKTKK